MVRPTRFERVTAGTARKQQRPKTHKHGDLATYN